MTSLIIGPEPKVMSRNEKSTLKFVAAIADWVKREGKKCIWKDLSFKVLDIDAYTL